MGDIWQDKGLGSVGARGGLDLIWADERVCTTAQDEQGCADLLGFWQTEPQHFGKTTVRLVLHLLPKNIDFCHRHRV
jgi:hypothetical protein